ncbi:MAG: radical SAM family heme chaperone HemW [Chitinophagaceae bacterium]|nr:radical SAM family heme chaperone HemW [Chitinophagaceae bacterium]
MAGIYIHIPFCRQACLYCNFHFSTTLKHKNDLIEALLKEIAMTEPFTAGEIIETIYLGGGTPSLLSADELKSIFSLLHSTFPIAENAEVTLEANPDDIAPENVRLWKEVGINRLSIGIQSFFEEDLKWMNRAHNAQQALQCIAEAQQAGFNNLSVDLIYGAPTLTDENWKYNVDRVLQLQVPHISCYALTVEPKTALQQFISKHKMQDVDPDQQARQFLQLINWLNKAGYEHYEISNFSLPGRRSRHNTSYWQGKPYYGFGPSAHSFDGIKTRSWNISNNALYTKSITAGILPVEKEVLTKTQQVNEYIMTSLRTSEGVDLNKIKNVFGENYYNSICKTVSLLGKEHVVVNDERIILTKEGKLFADGLAAALFAD